MAEDRTSPVFVVSMNALVIRPGVTVPWHLSSILTRAGLINSQKDLTKHEDGSVVIIPKEGVTTQQVLDYINEHG